MDRTTTVHPRRLVVLSLTMLFDTTAAVFRTDPDRLARVFDLANDERPSYAPDELGTILTHQLQVPVEFDLQNLDPGNRRLLKAAGECGDSRILLRTFGDLFRHPEPPIQLLHLTKNFAKGHLHHPDSPLPPEIATILYYASILAALLRWNRHITWLTHEELARGVRQVLRQPWLDAATRQLFQDGLNRLEGPSAAVLSPSPAEPTQAE